MLASAEAGEVAHSCCASMPDMMGRRVSSCHGTQEPDQAARQAQQAGLSVQELRAILSGGLLIVRARLPCCSEGPSQRSHCMSVRGAQPHA